MRQFCAGRGQGPQSGEPVVEAVKRALADRAVCVRTEVYKMDKIRYAGSL